MKERGDDGVTLIEVLIAVTLLGLAATTVLVAFATLSTTSTRHRDLADVQSVLASAGEIVASPSTSRVACVSAPSSYQAAARTVKLPAAWTSSVVTVSAVQSWDGTSFSACSAVNEAAGFNLQKVTLSVTSPNQRVTQVLDVYKGDEVVGDG
jgi:prepilin-type N-terminal cleavage/methylation domain-containing protein